MSRYVLGSLLVAGMIAGSLFFPAPVLADETVQSTQPPPPAGGGRDCESKKEEPKTS